MSSGKLKNREYADMKARLLLNLGLVYENLADFDKCKKLLFEAMELTKYILRQSHFIMYNRFCYIISDQISFTMNYFDVKSRLEQSTRRQIYLSKQENHTTMHSKLQLYSRVKRNAAIRSFVLG